MTDHLYREIEQLRARLATAEHLLRKASRATWALAETATSEYARGRWCGNAEEIDEFLKSTAD